ncbi:aspartate kinase [Lignipirellula cremea]|uniref:aspartate kinase n=1 Tax=Lignipirellula cremea TaxID=2528010 RepID=A0A518DNA4_9BACT|nr:aspartate kinase [Lignipirellula cremea]QDU93318.1 Aspartokinase [Lignipirellula cremea]
MSIIVQKFGGTSVADSQKIIAAARKAIRAQAEGHQVVMVVSAMGKNTDTLVDLAAEINDRPPAREMDMLLSTGEQVSVALMAMAIHSLGKKAVSLTGAQIGIRTDSTHTKARIKSISTERMQKLLDSGAIVIAAGFQGIDEDYNITTLGRGGSDTTAVALAAVLRADCEIYTDVDGVYTTDPRIMAEARRMSQVSYDEMLEMASLGAGVMHNRSIEFAKKYNVPIHVRHSGIDDSVGTLIVADPESPDQAVSGAALTKHEARITVTGVPDVPGASLKVFSPIAARAITVDMIVQNVSENGEANVSFTVPKNELGQTLEAVEEAVAEWDGARVSHDDQVAKISVVGLGMARMTGVANKMFHALADEGVNIQMITTSEIKISVLIHRDEALRALRAAHRAFLLHLPPPNLTPRAPAGARRADDDAADIIDRLRGVDMEELMIDEIRLDESQARVTINGIPNQPGIAARIFDEVAAADVFVDMIVQSFGDDATARLSFTTPADQIDRSVEVAKKLSAGLGCGDVTSDRRIAKLSVSGIGLRSHTGVAIRMFRSLSDAGINVSMINTSEVRVNVVVDHDRAKEALACLEKAFADVKK